MPRRPCTFRQQDVTRALKAATAAGIAVQRFEIDKNGKIVVVTGELEQADAVHKGGNEWDEI